MRDPGLVEVAGPLAPFAVGFLAWLELWGYARGSRAAHLRLVADLSGWLGGRGLDGGAVLSGGIVDEFVADRRAAGHRYARSARSLKPLQEHLRELGVTPPVVQQRVVGPVEAMVSDYACYLAKERGLSASTVVRETDLVRPFLAARVVEADGGLGLVR